MVTSGSSGTFPSLSADVRTFKVLLVGWILGGAFIVIIGAPATKSAERVVETRSPEGRAPAGRPALSGVEGRPALLLPVQGITPAQLRDTFAEARGNGRTHGALDILAARGTPVVACVDGTIQKLFNSRAGGLTIYQFDLDAKRVYYYAHLDRYADGIQEGQFVPQGTVIGYVGTTGNAPPGTPHLHFAIEDLPPTKEWWKGTPVNPYPLLMAR
jgi:murein DD-endopeptidase MepM/ murein hydrolase activator NlpD